MAIAQNNARISISLSGLSHEIMTDHSERSPEIACQTLRRLALERVPPTPDRRTFITFSAGFTRLVAEESPDKAIDRPDRAMRAAKRAGKNRVFIAT